MNIKLFIRYVFMITTARQWPDILHFISWVL